MNSFLQAFVASNPRIIWCPHPGCGQAVQNPDKTERNRSASVTSRTSQHSRTNQYQSLTAHCSNGHSFCWSCQLEPHDPATCDNYKSWIEKIVQVCMREEKLMPWIYARKKSGGWFLCTYVVIITIRYGVFLF